MNGAHALARLDETLSDEAMSDAAKSDDDSASALAAEASSARPAVLWPGALALVFALGSIVWFFALLVRDVEAADFDRVDMTRTRLDCGPGWVDPRWSELIAARLAELPAPRADEAETLAEVGGVLLTLPFVAEVLEARVIWPDGLELSLRLREPVACVRVGEQFLTVADDGTLLSGAWSLPPARDSGFLPLLALDREGHAQLVETEVLSGRQPLTSVAALDGLALANALWRDLPAGAFARLGRAVIDARRSRQASVEDPGSLLWLENGRRVWFGRAPNLDAPGELPVASKLESLARALDQLDTLDWELVDVRWDRPELLPRGGLPEHSDRGK